MHWVQVCGQSATRWVARVEIYIRCVYVLLEWFNNELTLTIQRARERSLWLRTLSKRSLSLALSCTQAINRASSWIIVSWHEYNKPELSREHSLSLLQHTLGKNTFNYSLSTQQVHMIVWLYVTNSYIKCICICIDVYISYILNVMVYRWNGMI